MKEYPVGHKFYKDKGLAHIEGKIPKKIKKMYQAAAKKDKRSLVFVVSEVLIKHAPKVK